MYFKQLCSKKGLTLKILVTSLRNLKKPEVANDAIMVTADLFGLYPIICHDVGLEALRKTLD